MTYRVLLVCMGNICRSPTAEGVLRYFIEAVATEIRRVLDAFGNHAGHVFNLGHGISQFIPPESVSVLVDTVHSYTRDSRARLMGRAGGVLAKCWALPVKHKIAL